MNRQLNLHAPLLLGAVVWACLTIFGLLAFADEPEHTTPFPGYRPPSEYAQSFLDTVDTATIAVLPTIVRRDDRTAHSFASQGRVVTYLNETGLATATSKSRRVKMPQMQRVSQWELFEYGMRTVADAIEGYRTDADYTLVMEILLPVDHAVFGIEVYILDQQGENAFSFLLNEHHEMFVDAKLYARSSSEDARIKMIAAATEVGLDALTRQIDMAR